MIICTPLITKMALKIVLNIFGRSCEVLTFKVIFLCQKLSESFEKNFIGGYQFKSPTFVKIVF